MKKKQKTPTAGRARPGKRSVAEKKDAVLQLLAGKATVEQLAQRLCVLPETVEEWRREALEGLECALRQQPQIAAAEDKTLRQENEQLKKAVTKLVMKSELLEQALDIERAKRPTGPGRSAR